MFSSHSNWRLPYFFATLIFLGVGSLPRLALCVGPGGHWAFELMGSACCGPTSASRASSLIEVGDTDCARDCTDTPLGIGLATPAPDGVHQLVPAASVAPPFVNAAFQNFVSLRSNFRSARPPELSPRHLRTTVDLC